MPMVHKFTTPIFARDEFGKRHLVAEVECETDVFGVEDQCFIGELRCYDLDSKSMVHVNAAEQTVGRHAWAFLHTKEARQAIDTEWRAHVVANGSDSLLDAAELKFRHNYESAE